MGQVIRGVGKDEVELLSATLQEFEYISFDRSQVRVAELLLHFADKVVLCGVNLDTYHPGAFARQQLETDGSCTGKQVERVDALEVDKVFQYVEYVFPCEIGSGSRFDVGGNIKPATPVLPADDAHIVFPFMVILFAAKIVKVEYRKSNLFELFVETHPILSKDTQSRIQKNKPV